MDLQNKTSDSTLIPNFRTSLSPTLSSTSSPSLSPSLSLISILTFSSVRNEELQNYVVVHNHENKLPGLNHLLSDPESP